MQRYDPDSIPPAVPPAVPSAETAKGAAARQTEATSRHAATGDAVSIDAVLESILRGAAKTLGCNSANLIVFNEASNEVRILIGLLLQRQQQLGEVESIIGGHINDLVFQLEQTRQTALYRSWHRREVVEEDRLAELARGAIPQALLEAADALIGSHRFLCVPVLGESHCYGTLIFEKRGAQPYSPQQRELLIRYANRIGEILENHARSMPLPASPTEPQTRLARLLLDKNGRVVGEADPSGEPHAGTGDGAEVDPVPEALLADVAAAARDMLASPQGNGTTKPGAAEAKAGARGAGARGAGAEAGARGVGAEAGARGAGAKAGARGAGAEAGARGAGAEAGARGAGAEAGAPGAGAPAEAPTAQRLLRFTNVGRPLATLAPSGEMEAELQRFQVDGEPRVLCEIRRLGSPTSRPIQNHLLQIALERSTRSAPALLLDPAFRVTSCNDGTEDLLGHAPEDLVGRDVACLFDDAANIHAILDHQFLFLSEGHYEETLMVRHRDGHALAARLEALLLADAQTRVIGYLLLLRERSEAEAAEPVEAGTSRCAREPPPMQRLMRQERLATMGELAGQLAHEIRNPLLAIGATLETVADEEDAAERAAVVASLSREIQRLDLVLKEYLSLAARRNATVGRVELRQVVQAAHELLQGHPHLAAERVQNEVPAGLNLVADFDGLKQVLFNLLINALQASAPPTPVRCHGQQTPTTFRLYVDDEGPGLDAPAGECLKPFYSTKPGGTGLGLAVCQRIVEAHDGHLRLEDRAGGGCRATVKLTRRREA